MRNAEVHFYSYYCSYLLLNKISCRANPKFGEKLEMIIFYGYYVLMDICTVKVHCRKTSVVCKIGKKRFLSIVGFEIFNKNRRRKAHCRKKMKNILLLMKESITNRILKLEFLWISQLIENFIYFTYFEQCEPVTLFRWLQGQQKRGCIGPCQKSFKPSS